MRSIDEDIKNGQFKTCYLLYGEEAYIRKQYRDKLKKALSVEGDTMNFASYEGKDTNPKELIDLGETMPFFADRRLILVEGSGFFKGTQDDLAEYMSQIPSSTTFVFVEDEVDKRSKLFKAVKDAGRAIEFQTLDHDTITRWLLGRMKRENKNITRAAMEEFFARVGTDMSNIDKELEKLFSYTLDKEVIELQDVTDICNEQVTNRIFAMVDAITERKQKEALEMYYDLLSLKEPPMRILFLIMRQYQILLHLKDMKRKNIASNDMAKLAGVPPFAVKKYISQASKLSNKSIIELLEYGTSMETAVKTGQMQEQIAVELVIIEASRDREYR